MTNRNAGLRVSLDARAVRFGTARPTRRSHDPVSKKDEGAPMLRLALALAAVLVTMTPVRAAEGNAASMVAASAAATLSADARMLADLDAERIETRRAVDRACAAARPISPVHRRACGGLRTLLIEVEAFAAALPGETDPTLRIEKVDIAHEVLFELRERALAFDPRG
jgi:hypothetical protein